MNDTKGQHVRFSVHQLSPNQVIPKQRFSLSKSKIEERANARRHRPNQGLLPDEELFQIDKEIEEEERKKLQAEALEKTVSEKKNRSFWGYFIWILVQIVILAMLRVGAGFVYEKITYVEPEPEPFEMPEPTFSEKYSRPISLVVAVAVWALVALALNVSGDDAEDTHTGDTKENFEKKRASLELKSLKEKLSQCLDSRETSLIILANNQGASVINDIAQERLQIPYVSLFTFCDSANGQVLRNLMKDASIPVVETCEGPFEEFLELIKSRTEMLEFLTKEENGDLVVLSTYEEERQIRTVLPGIGEEHYTHFAI